MNCSFLFASTFPTVRRQGSCVCFWFCVLHCSRLSPGGLSSAVARDLPRAVAESSFCRPLGVVAVPCCCWSSTPGREFSTCYLPATSKLLSGSSHWQQLLHSQHLGFWLNPYICLFTCFIILLIACRLSLRVCEKLLSAPIQPPPSGRLFWSFIFVVS